MSFREKSLESENYLKSFLTKINVEFAKSLPSVSQNLTGINDDDPEFNELLLEAEPEQPKPSTSSSKPEQKFVQIKELKKVEAVQEPKKAIKTEKLPPTSTITAIQKESKDYLNLDTHHEERLEDDSNIFGEDEIYDIMEIDNEEGEENIYMDDSTGKPGIGEDENEFILVNFKSSSEDLADTQFVVEELYDDEKGVTKIRRKTSNRMPKEIIEKYAQSTSTKQHICTKCVKVFSTRTNLIRHIQSHDGFKPFVCEICDKGFTQSGSLKQHMYIHSGETDNFKTM